MQLGTCIYINVWWYIHRISLCQLKSYKLVSHFIMRKTFTLYSLPYTKQLLNGDTHIHSLSLSLSFAFLKISWNNRLALFSLSKIWHYAMSAFLLWFLHTYHIKTWACNFCNRKDIFYLIWLWNIYLNYCTWNRCFEIIVKFFFW